MEELKEVMAKKTLTYNDVSKFDELTRTLTKKYDDEIIKNGHMVLRPTKDHPHSGKTMRIQRSQDKLYLACDPAKYRYGDCGFSTKFQPETYRFIPVDGLIDTYNLQSVSNSDMYLKKETGASSRLYLRSASDDPMQTEKSQMKFTKVSSDEYTISEMGTFDAKCGHDQ